MAVIQLDGFSPSEEDLIRQAENALQDAAYDLSPIKQLIRTDMPPGYRGMSLADGVALSAEAFVSQAMLNHVLEEELLHLVQKARDPEREFDPATARILEAEINEQRRFPCPKV